MQMAQALTIAVAATAPFAASARPSRAGRRALVARARASSEEWRASRRSLAAGMLAVPALLSAGSAWALIPDDDDEDLVKKARANRRSKLAEEKSAEQAFTRSEGFTK
jgi:hypothetical protein